MVAKVRNHVTSGLALLSVLTTNATARLDIAHAETIAKQNLLRQSLRFRATARWTVRVIFFHHAVMSIQILAKSVLTHGALRESFRTIAIARKGFASSVAFVKRKARKHI
jgi:hypothetical protein